MYHRVLRREEISPWDGQAGMTVEAGTFSRQVRYIRRHWKPVSLPRFIHHLEKRIPFPDRTCLITFDDGWRDNFVNAYPILKAHHVPAAVFLPTDFIGSRRRFWQQELARLLVAAYKRTVGDGGFPGRDPSLPGPKALRRVLEGKEAGLPERIAAFLAERKKEPLAENENLISVLEDALPEEGARAARSESVFLSWEEVRTMAADGIAFGSHGRSHALLAGLDPGRAEREIRESKETLETQLDRRIDAFSYPNGDWSPGLARTVREQGYRAAFGTQRGFVRAGADRYRIRRVNIHQDMTATLPFFLGRVAGLW